jgi:hypothetical protein
MFVLSAALQHSGQLLCFECQSEQAPDTCKYIMYKVQDYDFTGVLYNNAAHPVVHVCESRNAIYMGNIHDRIISLRRKVLVYTTVDGQQNSDCQYHLLS